MFRELCVQIRRLFTGRLWILSILTGLLCAISVSGLYSSTHDTWYLVFQSTQSEVSFLTLHFLPAMVFSWTLAEEMEKKAADYWIIRSGVFRYTISKFVAAAAGGFVCVFTGMWLFIICCNFIFPAYLVSTSDSIYDLLLSQGRLFTGYLFFVIDLSLSGAVAAVLGMLASVFILSPLAAIAAPLCLEMIFSFLSYLIRIPEQFDPNYWMRLYLGSGGLKGMAVNKIMVCVLAMIIMALIGSGKMKRRLEDGRY